LALGCYNVALARFRRSTADLFAKLLGSFCNGDVTLGVQTATTGCVTPETCP
jgi:hypothetical protein